MVEKRYAEAPLLYIDQPTVKQPEAEMQHQYKSKRKKNEKRPPGEQGEKETTYYSVSQQENPNQDAAKDEPETDNGKQVHSKKRKPFNKMSIKEKVLYFVHSSSYAPKVKCEVKTTERRYRGIITELKEKDVLIKAGARFYKVPLAEIMEIRMIGF